LNKVCHNLSFGIKGEQAKTSAHPNDEIVDPLFAIIHLHLKTNMPTCRLPFSPSITQTGKKGYVFDWAFFAGRRTLQRSRSLAQALKLARVWAGEQKVELLLRILPVIGYMLVMNS
jgi:hypothetical protein